MISIELDYENEKYFFKIHSETNPSIISLLKSYQIEKYGLEVKKEQKLKSFPIKGIFEIPISLYQNDGFMAMYEGYIKYKSKNYCLKFGINGSKKPEFILSLSLAVFFDHYDATKPIFEAYGGEYKISSYSIKHIDDNAYKDEIANKNEIRRRSKSQSFQKALKKDDNEIYHSIAEIKDVKAFSNRIMTKIFGFNNLGNTCFLNSSLQILIHSPLFIKNFLDDISNSQGKISKDSISYVFFDLIMDINSSDKNVFSPNKLISAFLNKCNLFSLGQQSDSQRFYRNITTIFVKEIGPQNTCVKNTFIGEIEYWNFYSCPYCFCTNKQQQNTNKQTFQDLLVYASDKESSIEDMINRTYELKFLKSSQKCGCGRNLNLIRSTKIYPNDYLSINIQKGQIETRTLKNNLITIRMLKIDDRIYEPYAINFHSGNSIDSGHYYR